MGLAAVLKPAVEAAGIAFVLLAHQSCNMMRGLRGRALHCPQDCLCLPPLRALALLRQQSYWIEHAADVPWCRAQASVGGGGHRFGLIAQRSCKDSHECGMARAVCDAFDGQFVSFVFLLHLGLCLSGISGTPLGQI